MCSLEWNVFYEDISQQIVVFNVFEHGKFLSDVAQTITKTTTKEQLSCELKRVIFYYFGGKCEYEVFISPLFTKNEQQFKKVDVKMQLELNYQSFVNYVWSHKYIILKRAKGK